ncbi:MAG: hypothetical protein M5U14_20720 [Acidimicrobiia bacterium]|nr:hypothetical protein [Acidimicrobiia bacterium]
MRHRHRRLRRQVTRASDCDSWFFVTTRQPGFDLDLAPDGIPLTRAQLAAELGDAIPPPISTPLVDWTDPVPSAGPRRDPHRRGRARISSPCVFETREQYQEALDRTLFGVGVDRLRKIVDLILELRRPQLGRSREIAAVSGALSDALPPLDPANLERVADGFENLETLRRHLEELVASAAAFDRALDPQRRYLRLVAAARAQAERDTRRVRDRATAALRRARRLVESAEGECGRAQAAVEAARTELTRAREAEQALISSPAYQDLRSLADLERHIEALSATVAEHERAVEDAAEQVARAEERVTSAKADLDEAGGDVADTTVELERAGRDALVELGLGDPAELLVGRVEAARGVVRHRRGEVADLVDLVRTARQADGRAEDAVAACTDARQRADEAAAALDAAARTLDHHRAELRRDAIAWHEALAGRGLIGATDPGVDALVAAADELDGDRGVWDQACRQAVAAARDRALLAEQAASATATGLRDERDAHIAERDAVAAQPHVAPPTPAWRTASRDERAGRPLWAAVDVAETVDEATLAGLEAGLEAAGLLDVWIGPDDPDRSELPCDLLADPRTTTTPNLAAWLHVAGDVDDEAVALRTARILEAVAVADQGSEPDASVWVGPDGRFRVGPTVGRAERVGASYLGAAARERHRLAELARLDAAIARLDRLIADADADTERAAGLRAALTGALAARPDPAAVVAAFAALTEAGVRRRADEEALAAADRKLRAVRDQGARAHQRVADRARDLALPAALERLEALDDALARIGEGLGALERAVERRGFARRHHDLAERARDRERALLDAFRARFAADRDRLAGLETRRHTILETFDGDPAELAARVTDARGQVEEADRGLAASQETWTRAREDRSSAGNELTHAEESASTAAVAWERAGERALCVRDASILAAFDGELDVYAGGEIEALLGAVLDSAGDELRAASLEAGADLDDPAAIERVANRAEGAVMTANSRLMSELTGAWHTVYVPGEHYREIRVQSPESGELSLFEVVERVREEIGNHRSRVSAGEAELFTNHLFQVVVTEIRHRMNETAALVAEVNDGLAEAKTSSQLSLALEWRLRDRRSRRACCGRAGPSRPRPAQRAPAAQPQGLLPAPDRGGPGREPRARLRRGAARGAGLPALAPVQRPASQRGPDHDHDHPQGHEGPVGRRGRQRHPPADVRGARRPLSRRAPGRAAAAGPRRGLRGDRRQPPGARSWASWSPGASTR